MALNANKILKVIDDFKFAKMDVVAGAIEIYRTALINRDASGNAKLSTNTTGEAFAGMAVEPVSQAAGASAGDNEVELISAGSGKAILVKLTGVTKADLYKTVYASADDAVSLTAGNGVVVGEIVAIETTNYCWVVI